MNTTLLDRLLGRNKPLKADPKSHLCLYPFFNMMVAANGKLKPCCKWTEVLHHDGIALSSPDNTLEEAWQSDEMAQLRKDFLAGKMPDKCAVCWKEESSGIKSMRYDSFDYGLREDILQTPPSPRRLDLYPSNVCNLKCRICSPEYSSKWIQEAKETLNVEESVHLNFTEENMALVKSWLPDIFELGLFGGEPLYLKETISLLEYCVESGHSKHITLLINTNATIYSPALVALFKSFKKVLLNFSIDDIEKRFEYQRKGAKWEEAMSNIKEYVLAGGFTQEDQIECKICCTVSTLNIYYLPELFKQINSAFPGMKLYLNFLHGPYSLSAINLPDSVKAILKEHLLAHNAAFKLQFDKKHTRTTANILDFLDTPPNQDFSAFFKEIQRGDQYRKENFAATFPEFWKIISPYQA